MEGQTPITALNSWSPNISRSIFEFSSLVIFSYAHPRNKVSWRPEPHSFRVRIVQALIATVVLPAVQGPVYHPHEFGEHGPPAWM